MLNPFNMHWVRVKKEKYEKFLNSPTQKEKFVKVLDEKFDMFNKRQAEEISNVRSIYFAITRKCNMRCPFCTMNSTPEISTVGELSLQDIISMVVPKIVNLDARKIVITGGEPLVRKDAVNILKLFSERFGRDKIVMQTNGLLLDVRKLAEIKDYIGALEISIENLFENARLLNNMKRIFELANEYNIVLGFSFVIDTNTVKYLLNGVDLCHKYNAVFTMRIVSLVGRAVENNLEDNVCQSKSTLEIYCKVVEYIIEKEYFEENIVSCFSGNLQPKRHCGAFGKILAIHPDGTVFMCGNFKDSKFSIGNVKEDSMSQIVKNLNEKIKDNKYTESFCVDRNVMCEDCDIKYFCSGPCMAEVAENSDSMKKIKEKCMAKRILTYYAMFYYRGDKSVKENLLIFLNYVRENISRLEN